MRIRVFLALTTRIVILSSSPTKAFVRNPLQKRRIFPTTRIDDVNSIMRNVAIPQRKEEIQNTSDDDVTEIIRRDAIEEMDRTFEFFSRKGKNGDRTPLLLRTKTEVSSYIERNFDAILFDCDGVLYRGSSTIPEASQCIKSLINDLKKKVFFVTNNAGQNRSQLCDKLITMLDCPCLQEEQMISSSYSCAKYLQNRLLLSSNRSSESTIPLVYVIGTDGLCEEIRSMGLNVIGGSSSPPPSSQGDKPSMSREDLSTYEFNTNDQQEPIDAVVIGLDTSFNYRKLCIAVGYLQRYPDALLVATNKDAFDLVGSDARRLPGNGALVQAVELASQRKALNVGKPSDILANLIEEENNLDPKRTLVVGDRLDTDIRFALNGRMGAALVMTGCTDVEKLKEVSDGSEDEPLPTVIFPHMGMMA